MEECWWSWVEKLLCETNLWRNHRLGGRPQPWGTSKAFGTITMAKRDHSLMFLFCRPVMGGVWEMKLTFGFNAYAFCLVQFIVISLFDIKLLLFIVYHICALYYEYSSTPLRFTMQKPIVGHYVRFLLVFFYDVTPLFHIVFGMSSVNLDGEHSMPCFEITSSFFHIPHNVYCLDHCRRGL
jgi:hypothetical protein